MELPKEIQELILTRFMGEMQPERERELQLWLDESPAHRKEYAQFCAFCYAVRCGEKLSAIDRERGWERLKKKLHRRKLTHYFSIAAAAVAAFVVLFIGVYWLFTPSKEVVPVVQHASIWEQAEITLVLSSGDSIQVKRDNLPEIQHEGSIVHTDSLGLHYLKNEITELKKQAYHELIVPKCGEYQLRLSDGSRVILNAESKLRYPVNFTGEQREVYLEGEAYFEVVKDSLRPFIVHTSKADVRVLGTLFNISSYDRERTTEVTLVNGKVQVCVGDDQNELRSNEQLVLNHETVDIEMRTVNALNYIAWTKGLFRFEAMPLHQLMMKLERWYGVSYEFKDQSLKSLRFTGGFRKYDNIYLIVKMLDELTDVDFSIVDNIIVIDKTNNKVKT